MKLKNLTSHIKEFRTALRRVAAVVLNIKVNIKEQETPSIMLYFIDTIMWYIWRYTVLNLIMYFSFQTVSFLVDSKTWRIVTFYLFFEV